MKRSLYLIAASCFFLSSCFETVHPLLVQGPSPKKQKQKIALLQKKLDLAQKERDKIQLDVERIAREIDEARIALIRKQIDDFQKRSDTTSDFFVEEREALYRMIQSGPSPSAFEAQLELDRILRMITQRSDEGKDEF